ncbi:transcription factor domain-containing protein [Aspergillus undulatus]|uniref:transcription factor domain-containing protein n=1 Tax=Aspergillus undulatus TaxID=1810928 RepID=UPI003CCCB26F
MPPEHNSKQRGKYTTRACEECRRRRAKCDGSRPACSRCLQWQVSCQYSTAEDGRRPAPKAYVLQLRQRIETLERLLEHHGIDPRVGKASGKAKQKDTSNEIDELTESFEGRLALDEALNFDGDGEMRYFGPMSGRLQFGGSSKASASVNLNVDDPASVNPWFAVIDEELFRQDMVTGGRYWSPLLHISILAVGSRYSHRLDVRSDPDDSNTAGRMFLEVAKPYLQREMERPSVTTIQALVAMGMFYIATGADAAGWLHHGMANRLSLDMGLNLDPAGFQETNILSIREVQLRRQIYWALYCHDKWSSLYTGRICSMLDPQGAVRIPDLDNEDIANTDSPTRCTFRSLQRAMIRISQIQEKIILSLWAPKLRLPAAQHASFLKTCLLDLKTWFYDLPPDLRIERPTPNNIPQKDREARNLASNGNNLDTGVSAETITDLALSVSSESARAICLTGQKYRNVFGGFQHSPISATHCTLSAALVLLDSDPTTTTASLKNKLNICLTILEELGDSWQPARHIAHNLRNLCLSITSDEKFSVIAMDTKSGDEHTNQSLNPPLDIEIELPYDALDGSSSNMDGRTGQIQMTSALPISHYAELSVPVEALPADYGFFDILNEATWEEYGSMTV